MSEVETLQNEIERLRADRDAFAKRYENDQLIIERLRAAAELVLERYGRTDDNPAIRATREALKGGGE